MSLRSGTESGSLPPAGSFGPVTITDIVRFAGAGGDFNPLHHDPDYARAAGFAGPIAMGQFTAGLMAAWLTDWCGVENVRSYGVRFSAPLAIGDTVEFTAAEAPAASATRANVKLLLTATCSGKTILRGTAELLRTPSVVTPQSPGAEQAAPRSKQ